MSPAPSRPRRLLVCSLLATLLLLLIAAQILRLPERLWFAWQQGEHPPAAQAHALWLPDYAVEVEALAIAGLDDNLSALTFDPHRHTLFALADRDQLIELSLEGRILRRIGLDGFGDPEGLEFIRDGVFVISDERAQRLLSIQIDDATTRLDAIDARQLQLGADTGSNKGLEGLAYDPQQQRLLVAQERDPLRIYEITGFPYPDARHPSRVDITDNPVRDAGLFMRDLSSLVVDPHSGHLLVLSDESRLLLELDEEGEPLSSLSLLPGSGGLKRGIAQAEGVTLDDRGNLYVVGEPNLLYIFRKQAPAIPANP